MSPMRMRMIEDMVLAGLAKSTQAVYVKAVCKLTAHYGRSPDTFTEEEVRAYLVSMRERGVARGTFKAHHFGIQFFYCQTLNREWALFLKKDSPTTSEAPSDCTYSRPGARPAGPRNQPNPQSLLHGHVRLWLAHRRGRDAAGYRNRQDQHGLARDWQGQHRAAYTAAATDI
jgi:hypothetical protein